MANPTQSPALPTQSPALPTQPELFFAPATLGKARISYDRDSRAYSVWAPGHSIRSTKRFSKALDLLTGLS